MKKNTVVVSSIFALILNFAGVADSSGSGGVAAKENLRILLQKRTCKECDLSGLNFNRMDLSGVDIEGADLSLSTFFLTDLSGANMKGCTLNGAVFGGADLEQADLRGADLRGVDMSTAYITGALLDGGFITDVPYENIGVTELEKEVYVEEQEKPKKNPDNKTAVVVAENVTTEQPGDDGGALQTVQPEAPEVKKINPVETAVVSMPKVEEPPAETAVEKVESGNAVEKTEPVPELQPAENPKKKQLERLLDTKRCYGCDLSGLDLSGKNLKNADLEAADLSGCNLLDANLENANLKGANLKDADLRNADLESADLYKADLRGADLTGTKRKNTLLDGALLEGTVGLSEGM
ncbi:pentapeptide repeat-containing protein [Desulforhopalus singaporensis]|uniref:Uncharacterized low-complexity proteins n=1 Tax=Desulforhopalus singaporensis TaxID=91360 RepID=A0A1H0Q0V9_9BACT|nr:pentapeptide repeat-containing protein [Desulforhopalus singaporensis]SDP10279.1 Uncharacterized low-complexity proteins [Desulforhopalus singaporensis]